SLLRARGCPAQESSDCKLAEKATWKTRGRSGWRLLCKTPGCFRRESPAHAETDRRHWDLFEFQPKSFLPGDLFEDKLHAVFEKHNLPGWSVVPSLQLGRNLSTSCEAALVVKPKARLGEPW